MAVLRIKGFAGAIPVTGDRELPDNAAVDSFNTWLYGKELRGVRPPTHLLDINTGIRKVFRVPKRRPGVPPSDLTPDESVWVQFADRDTDVVKGQLVEDKFERYYFCSPTEGPRFNTYARMLAALPSMKLGVPGPDNTLDANEDNPNKPTITSITSQKLSDDLYEIEFKISVGATGATAYTNSGGTGNRTALITTLGANVASAANLVNGDKDETGVHFSDMTAPSSYIRWDFGALRIIDEFTWYQKGNNTYGTWTIEGSVSDAVTWVQLGSAILGGNPQQPYRFTNVTAYRWYRLRMEPASNVTFTTCAYCYTWENEFGEESPPSLPVIGAGDANGVWRIGNIKDPPDPGPEYPHYVKKHLYRTLSGGEGNFYRVSSHVIGSATSTAGWNTQTSYVDDRQKLPDTVLDSKLPLESTFWEPPPDSLQGWVAMPNGFLVGFDKAVETPAGSGTFIGGNTIYMSESYHFHAWPVAFKYATETQIVGLGVIGQTCVVCTQGYPATVTGSKPATCSFTKATTGEPCMARGSIVSTPQGIVYASQNGLVQVGANGIANVTETIITRDEWLIKYAPIHLRSVRYQNGYLALRMPPLPSPRSGFFLDPTSLDVALTEFSDFADIRGICTDFWSGEVLLIREGEVLRWDTPSDELMPVRWRSKEFQYDFQENFGAYAIYWDDSRFSADPWGAAEILPVDKHVQFTVFADRRIVYDEDVPLNGRPVRLPSGFKADIWQFEIRARAPVYSLHVASTVKELRNV
jgi:hypothetical protein